MKTVSHPQSKRALAGLLSVLCLSFVICGIPLIVAADEITSLDSVSSEVPLEPDATKAAPKIEVTKEGDYNASGMKILDVSLGDTYDSVAQKLKTYNPRFSEYIQRLSRPFESGQYIALARLSHIVSNGGGLWEDSLDGEAIDVYFDHPNSANAEQLSPKRDEEGQEILPETGGAIMISRLLGYRAGTQPDKKAIMEGIVREYGQPSYWGDWDFGESSKKTTGLEFIWAYDTSGNFISVENPAWANCLKGRLPSKNIASNPSAPRAYFPTCGYTLWIGLAINEDDTIPLIQANLYNQERMTENIEAYGAFELQVTDKEKSDKKSKARSIVPNF